MGSELNSVDPVPHGAGLNFDENNQLQIDIVSLNRPAFRSVYLFPSLPNVLGRNKM